MRTAGTHPRTVLALAIACAATAIAASPGAAGGAAVGAGSASAGTGALDADGVQHVAGEVLVRLRGERRERRVELPADTSVDQALSELAEDPEVRWAEPNAIARIAAIPRDPGRAGWPGGWQEDQWNFLTPPDGVCTASDPCGVDAITAWRRLEEMGRPAGRLPDGSRGSVVAVIDTGVAYRRWGKRFRRSPDLAGSAFTKGRDLLAGNDRPLDRNGHGTHVASTIVERTDNDVGVTGLADGLRVMPIRALDANGEGTARDVARGIRWATRNRAQVINLSLEFPPSFASCKSLRSVCQAIRRARKRGVLVVAPTGNRGIERVQMPGRVAMAVGASTITGCLADYSSRGRGVDLVAPGGGPDDPGAGIHCAGGGGGPGIVQLTIREGAAIRGQFHRFGYPRYEGTSMAAAHVSAAAGLVHSSRILHRRLGRSPGAREIQRWLQCTARPIEAGPRTGLLYGAGLLNVGRAVNPSHPCPGL